MTIRSGAIGAVSPRGRYHIAASLLEGEGGRLLDVGARDAGLRSLLDDARFEYRSADLEKGTHDYGLDLEETLPFDDGNFAWVVALDVLEHVDRIHAATAELLRIAREGCVLSLPNLASVPHRVRFLAAGRLSTDKYDLPESPARDRHRWLVHLADADRFVEAAAERAGFTVGARVLECEGRTRFGRLAACGLLRASAPLAPMLASRAVYRLERRARRAEP